MADTHPIRNGIIATVAGGVILAGLGKLWPPATRLLTVTVQLPVWLLLLVAATLAWLSVGIRHRLRKAHQVAATTTTPNPARDLSSFEGQVLARIAKGDGDAIPRDTIKRSLGGTNIRIQAAVDRLVEAELVEELESLDDPEDVVVVLTSKGRQYVVEHGLG